jgi:NAD(P)-dependent dehydrogenase (short-subunit alcohol dehydrogenase family)
MLLDGKNVIITGATSGIGTEAAIEIAKRNPCLVLPVRNLEKGEQVKKHIVARDFAREYTKRFSGLHLLINNAGIWEFKKSETKDGIEMTFGVNHLGPFLRPVFGVFMKSPRQGAETIVYLALSSEINGNTGGYYVNKKNIKPSGDALNNETAKKLWELSSEYTGLFTAMPDLSYDGHKAKP